jgi:hypothetical protein
LVEVELISVMRATDMVEPPLGAVSV